MEAGPTVTEGPQAGTLPAQAVRTADDGERDARATRALQEELYDEGMLARPKEHPKPEGTNAKPRIPDPEIAQPGAGWSGEIMRPAMARKLANGDVVPRERDLKAAIIS